MSFDKAIDNLQKRVVALEEENKNLRAIVAKEVSENDELGSEFVYVTELKREVERLKEENLKWIDRYAKLLDKLQEQSFK